MNYSKSIEIVREMPKVELHLHLEGAFTFEFLFDLIQKRGNEKNIRDVNELRRQFVFKDFQDFIRIWFWKNKFFQSPADFEESAYRTLKELSRQNVIYAEAFFSPWDFLPNGLHVDEIAEATISGVKRAERECPIKCRLIADIVRNYGSENAEERVRQVARYIGEGVIGIGLGGNERDFPPGPFRPAFRLARDIGFRTTAHAGEASGARSVWDTVQELKVERIGHGVRAVEDDRLLEFLRTNQIPLEVCITSNLRTGVFRSLEDHPFDRMFKEGLLVTVNSDDPSMFGATITDEFVLLVDRLGYSGDDLKQLTLNAINSAFLSKAEKEMHREKILKFWSNATLQERG